MVEISKCDARPPVVASIASLRDVIDEAWSAYLTAAEQAGEACIDVDIAGSRVRLCFARERTHRAYYDVARSSADPAT